MQTEPLSRPLAGITIAGNRGNAIIFQLVWVEQPTKFDLVVNLKTAKAPSSPAPTEVIE
jgi:hypothetical protein